MTSGTVRATPDDLTGVPATGLRIRLLGGFHVVASGRELRPGDWALRKGADLIKLLALAPEHRLHREQLMDLLWPDKDPAAAANNLYQAVHAARNALGRASDRRWLTLQGGVVALDGDVWVDVDMFEDALQRAHGGDLGAVAAARSLYRGELLPDDRYEGWSDARRIALAEARRRLLSEQATAFEAAGRLDDALSCLKELVADDQVDEEAAGREMQLEARMGNRAAALRTYDSLRDALERDLDLEPSPALLALRRDVLEGGLGPALTPPVRHNLPAPLTSFVGRDLQANDVRRLLERTRLLTLTGTGGTGKTRLALELARELVPRYGGGVWLVELAAVSEPSGVVRAVGDVLGVREAPGSSLLDTLVQHLAASETLVVLDNCEHLIAACAELTAALLARCPELRILATSRQPMRVPGEMLFRVPSLAVPDPSAEDDLDQLGAVDAVRLFLDRASAVDPSFELTAANARDVAAVCYHLDGLPLAIELAASRVTLLPVSVLAERLPERFRLLVGGNRAALTRQQTLKATLDWSYNLLPLEQQYVLDRLSVFAGGATFDATEAVCAGPPVGASDVLPILGELVDQSLLVLDTTGLAPRYRQLETVREYSRERLAERNQASATEAAHGRWALELTEPAALGHPGEGWLDAFRRLGPELENLRAALDRAVPRDPPVALELAHNLWPYWLWDGHLVEGRAWLEAALLAAPEPTSLRGRALLGLCAVLGRAGDTAEHARRAIEALDIARQRGDPVATTWALQFLGIAHWASDQLELALEDFGAAVDTGRAGFPAGAIAALHSLAAVHWTNGDRSRARALVEEALQAAADMPADGPLLPPAIDIAFEIIRIDAATGIRLLVMEENASAFRDTSPGAAVGYLLGTRGTMARFEGDVGAARRDFEDALERFRALGDLRGEAALEVRLGTLARDYDGLMEARKHLARALAIRRDLGDSRGVSLTEALLGDLEILAGDLEAAERLLASSIGAARRRADLWNIGGALNYRVGLALARGDLTSARALLEENLRISQRTGRIRHAAHSHLRLAGVARLAGDDFRPDASMAATLFEQVGDTAGLAAARSLAATHASASRNG